MAKTTPALLVLFLGLAVTVCQAAGAPAPATAPAAAGPASRPAADIDYGKVLLYVGPPPGVKVRKGPGQQTFEAIVAGYSMEFTKQFKDGARSGMPAPQLSDKSGDALKKEAVDGDIGFICQVLVHDFNYTPSKYEHRASQQMMVQRGGKWETLFQGAIALSSGMSFTSFGEAKAFIPMLKDDCEPRPLFEAAAARLVPVTVKSSAKLPPAPGGAKGAKIEFVLKVQNKLPYEIGPSVVITARAGKYKLGIHTKLSAAMEPGAEQEVTVSVDPSDTPAGASPAAWTFSILENEPAARGAGGGGRGGRGGGRRG